VLRVARLLRLLRVARMGRLLRHVTELVIFLKGVMAAARAVVAILILVMGAMYVWAICFTQMMRGSEAGDSNFNSVWRSMRTLWIHGALLDDVNEVMVKLEKESVICVLMFDIFILTATFGLLNMLIGVLCQVVSSVAVAEKDAIYLRSAKANVQRIFECGTRECESPYQSKIFKDGEDTISKEKFLRILQSGEGARSIQELGVDPLSFVDYADQIFADEDNDEKALSVDEFISAALDLRSANTATVKDIVGVRKVIVQNICKEMVCIRDLRTDVDEGLSNAMTSIDTLRQGQTDLNSRLHSELTFMHDLKSDMVSLRGSMLDMAGFRGSMLAVPDEPSAGPQVNAMEQHSSSNTHEVVTPRSRMLRELCDEFSMPGHLQPDTEDV